MVVNCRCGPAWKKGRKGWNLWKFEADPIDRILIPQLYQKEDHSMAGMLEGRIWILVGEKEEGDWRRLNMKDPKGTTDGKWGAYQGWYNWDWAGAAVSSFSLKVQLWVCLHSPEKRIIAVQGSIVAIAWGRVGKQFQLSFFFWDARKRVETMLCFSSKGFRIHISKVLNSGCALQIPGAFWRST